jgi:hypothetical protein
MSIDRLVASSEAALSTLGSGSRSQADQEVRHVEQEGGRRPPGETLHADGGAYLMARHAARYAKRSRARLKPAAACG